MGGGFRIFNQFAVFTYSQMQSVLPDSTLGSISDWDNFLQLDLNRVDLPYKTPDEYVLNDDFHRLVLASKLPRPSKFVEQSINFNKTLCKQLLGNDIVKSKLIRGLSAFDPAVILDGPENNYVDAIEKLSSHFVSAGLISSSSKATVVSQYRSFATKLRLEVPEYDDWIHFMSTHYELQSRPELFQVFKFSCQCLPTTMELPPEFVVPLPNLESDDDMFRSCVRSLQLSYFSIPHVSSLYRDSRSISRVFRLLGRGSDLLSDKKFSIWNFMKGSGVRRTSMLGKLETGYRKAALQYERPVISSTTTTPSVSRTSSISSSPSPDPSLSRASVPVSRCNETVNEGTVRKTPVKLVKSKRN